MNSINISSSYFVSHHHVISRLLCSSENWAKLLLLFLFLRCLFAYISQRNKPFINWPVIGAVPALILNIHHLHDWLTDCLRRVGGTAISYLSGVVIIVTSKPQNIEYILRTNFENFPKGEDFHEILDVLGKGLLNVDGDVWLKHRKIAAAHLHTKQIRRNSANNTQHLISKKLIPVLEHYGRSGKAFDLQDVILRFTFDNVSRNVFGTDYNCLADENGNIALGVHPFAKTVDTFTEVILYRHFLPPWMRHLARRLKLGKERDAANAMAAAHRFIDQSIALRRNQLTDHKNNYYYKEGAEDLLARYILQFPDEEDHVFLRDTCLNMLAAGRDTTGTGLTWFFWILWKNPRVKTKILDELNTDRCDQQL